MSLQLAVWIFCFVSVVLCVDIPSVDVLPPFEEKLTKVEYAPAKKEGRSLPTHSHSAPRISSGSLSSDSAAQTLKLDQSISQDGSYNYAYETDNGILASQQGTTRSVPNNNGDAELQVQGSYAFTAPDGQQYSVQYVADENGYRPIGDHLPTAPPIPESISRALKYLESH